MTDHPCQGRKRSGIRCPYLGHVRVHGQWYCRRHADWIRRKPVRPFPEERLRAIKKLIDDPHRDTRLYWKVFVEEFPALVDELLRLRRR